MKKTSSVIALISAIITLLVISSCEPKQPESTEHVKEFRNYIAAYTSGVIPVNSDIKVRLSFDLDSTMLEEKPDLFSLFPSTRGSYFVTAGNTLTFRPESPLKPGTVYTVKFKLGKMMEVPEALKTFRFKVQTVVPSFRFYSKGLTPYEDNKRLTMFSGEILSSDVIDDEKIEKAVAARLDGKEAPITWMHQSNGKSHELRIDSIQRKENARELVISWDGNAVGIDASGSDTLEIPALGAFKITGIKVVQQPDQRILVKFSDPLDPKQDLEGMIRINGAGNLRLSIENNVITAYPSVRLAGQKKIVIAAGIKNEFGKKLKETKITHLSFERMKPEVRLIGQGVILPNSKGLILPFKAVSLRAVDIHIIKIFEDNIGQFLQNNKMDNNYQMKRVGRPVVQKTIRLTSEQSLDYGQWNTFSLDLAELIKDDPGAIYRVELSFRKEYSLYSCNGEEIPADDLQIGDFDQVDENDDYWNGPGGYLSYYPANFRWSERENPCHDSYYYYDRFPSRNILASDLGIIAKEGSYNNLTFAITDLISTRPVMGAELELLNYQLQPVKTLYTDEKGMVSVDLKYKPFLLIAKKGDQRGYLRLDDGSSLSLSKFDISGVKVHDGIKGYIYGERGVWRPGDSLHLIYILEDNKKLLPANHPVIFEMYDPLGKMVKRMVKTTGVEGFYNFRTTTAKDAPTGNWLARVKVGGAVFSKKIKIETVKPNRLKINLSFANKILLPDEDNEAKLEVKWLTGVTARNLKSRVDVIFTKKKTKFEDFRNYIFEDPSKRFYSEEENVFDGKLDEKGEASIDLDLSHKNSPGMLNAIFTTKVFEEGGDFSINYLKKEYAPYSTFVGLKLPEAENKYRMYFTDKTYTVEVATVDPDGHAVSSGKVTATVYRVRWRWWWDASDDDLASYFSNRYHEAIITKTLSTKNGKGSFEFRIPKADWGRYFIRVEDKESGHSAGTSCYIDWPDWYSKDNSGVAGGATMLLFTSDKEKYNVGETCKINIPSGGEGRALVCIENGSEVIQASWLELEPKQTTYEFEVSPEMAPNVYVNITLLQPHAQTINDRPIRLYGVIPIMVEDPATILKPEIIMPEEIRPESEVEITVYEKNDRPMTYTLAVVDEGLLDLTNFKTPDPWKTFYAREALGVKTWDMFDYVIGAYGGTIEQMFAIGGDEEVDTKAEKSANRFKPVVKFFGPFELEKGKQTHSFTMPNYIGSVRTMVVAGYKGAYGSAQKATPVKKPLMVLATLPRVLGPRESVTLPVTVFAMDEKISDVEIKVEASDIFDLGIKSKKISFTQTGDQVVEYDLKVKPEIGIGKVHIVASGGGETATYDIEIDIRNPNPPVTNTISKIINAGQSMEIDYTMPGMAGTNSGEVEVSSIPPIDLSKRLKYLMRYPYRCAEQTISSVFPQLFLKNIMELSTEQSQRIDQNIISGINSLKRFQIFNGGIGMWPGATYVSDWATNYVGHFLLEAKKQGFSLPLEFKDAWIGYQRKAANEWEPYHEDYRGYYRQNDLIQAYRLFTLALSGNPEFGAMNRLKSNSNRSLQASWMLAAAYAMAGQPEVAIDITYNLGMEVPKYKYMSSSFGSSLRDQALILYTLSLMDEKERGIPLLKKIAKTMSSNRWMSTQTTAFCLISVSEYTGAGKKEDQLLDFTFKTDNGKEEKISSDLPVHSVQLPADQVSGKISLSNNSEHEMFVQISMTGTPVIGDTTSSAENLDIEIVYKTMDGKPINVSKLAQGTDFMAQVTIKNPGLLGRYENMALNQIFPSGWEINNLRLFDLESSATIDKPTYQNIRDDRVYTYFDIRPNEVKKFIVLLNATYMGKFYLPTVSCEAMYNNDINARKPGRWVEVIKDGM